MGCSHQPIKPSVVAACTPSILVEPVRPVRPEIFLYFKIEDNKKYLAMDDDDFKAIKAYILSLEGSLDFSIREIRESNDYQFNGLGNKQ